ncbi:hypothetical protein CHINAEXTREME_02195 [Halobiforma lacisalsi AJ5]|uniref:Uncharacterized protein n=1 Tax=Natronobacterium lacisalsi AJ5 TaxID=358396 RepID=M0LG63_NATLA|nr:hypothetical protein [Halobiforma lacisalsi]APW96654.1 hypothetical protein CHINAEXTREME_02195 [Halobiforma lacisalsi AJ5]EMA32063.1 hypothetical protein C445_12151 [Halobiforma lacisalsi AJ5]
MSERTPALRRTVLYAIGTIPTATAAAVALGNSRLPDDDTGANGVDYPSSARTAIATVDRIVDGDHVVLLLEDGGEVVDQVVVPVEEFGSAEEGDIAIVVVEGGDLLAHLLVPERPC